MGEPRLRAVTLTRDMMERMGVAFDDRPMIGWAGYTIDPRARGKRSIIIDGKRVRLVCCGGLYWREGLCWLFLAGTQSSRVNGKVVFNRTSAVAVVRRAKIMLEKARQLGEKLVVVARDEAPRSAKLLTLLGFKRHPETVNGVEIWVLQWPH